MTSAAMPFDPAVVAALGPDVSDHRLTRPDGRIVAWTESGAAAGRPVLRVPGTPGSRLTLRADRTAWIERDVRMLTTERPGFGASTRLEGRGFDEPADDLAAILDHLGIDRLPVIGGSGAAPHILAFAARHPDRVTAATIVVGAAPLLDSELDQQIEINARGSRLIRDGRIDEVWDLNVAYRDAILADPLAGFTELMADSTDADRAVMQDPGWQRGFAIGVTEALRQGPGGWFDEDVAVERPWGFDPATVTTDITWWHSDGDRNAPLSAARRLVAALPNAHLRVWTDAGHLTPFWKEPEVLDELLARG